MARRPLDTTMYVCTAKLDEYRPDLSKPFMIIYTLHSLSALHNTMAAALRCSHGHILPHNTCIAWQQTCTCLWAVAGRGPKYDMILDVHVMMCTLDTSKSIWAAPIDPCTELYQSQSDVIS